MVKGGKKGVTRRDRRTRRRQSQRDSKSVKGIIYKNRNRNEITKMKGGNSNKCLVFKFNKKYGFFSQIFFLCIYYSYTKKNNIDFFIDDSDWTYSSKNGWHDYFTSLNRWSQNTVNYTSVEHFSPDSSGRIFPDLTVEEYIQILHELCKPTDIVQKRVEEFVKIINGPFTSIYVRKGDKVSGNSKEMDNLTSQDIIKKINLKPEELSKIYIMTDDYTVVEEFRTILQTSKIYTTTLKENRGMHRDTINAMTPEQKYEHTIDLISSSFIFFKGAVCWTDVRSNVGRFQKLYEFEKVRLYPTEPILKKSDTIHPLKHLDPD